MATLILNGNWSFPYNKLEYIENPNDAYINTKYIPNPDTVVDTEALLVPTASARYSTLSGTNTDPLWGDFLLYYHNSSKFICLEVGGRYKFADYTTSLDTKHRFVYSENSLTIDGKQTKLIDDKLKLTKHLEMYLFNSNLDNEVVPSPKYDSKSRIYYFKIFEKGRLVMNLIPVQHITDGEVGLYDTVSRYFFTSPNGSKFIPGPKIK